MSSADMFSYRTSILRLHGVLPPPQIVSHAAVYWHHLTSLSVVTVVVSQVAEKARLYISFGIGEIHFLG